MALVRWVLGIAIVVVLLLAIFGADYGVVSVSTQSRRPNILFILTDDQDIETMRFMPRLQALMAAQGLTFVNMFVTQSVCCPSRASILRGQYPHNTTIVHNRPPLGGFVKFRDLGHESSTLATWLQAAGYRTALFGKYLNGYPTPDDPSHAPPGWSAWHGANEGLTRYYNYRITENEHVVSYGTRPSDYRTDVLTEQVLAFIETRERNATQPFFIYFSPPAPHGDAAGDGPAIPAPRHLGTFADVSAPRPPSFNEPDVSDKPPDIQRLPQLTDEQIAELDDEYRTRIGALLAVDEAIERIIGALAARGELENTYIFFTSDNGYKLGQHRIPRGKNTLFEEDIRVPLIVRGPGVPAGLSREHFALNIDFAPTFAELAGGRAPEFVDGRSLVPVLGAAATPFGEWRTEFLVEVTGPEFDTHRGLRTRDEAYFEYSSGHVSLYDLHADPYQINSLHKTVPAERLAALSARLSRLATCAGPTCRGR